MSLRSYSFAALIVIAASFSPISHAQEQSATAVSASSLTPTPTASPQPAAAKSGLAAFADFFKDIGTVLAQGLKDQPILCAIILIVLVAGIVVLFSDSPNKIPWFFVFLVICVVAVLVVFLRQRSAQQTEVRQSSGPAIQPNRGVTPDQLFDKLTADQKVQIRKILQGAAEDAADALDVSATLVRANIFAPSGNELRIIRELTFNMHDKAEMELSLPVGVGSTGRSFVSGKPNIAIFSPIEGWREAAIPAIQTVKLNPELQWIISVPVKGEGESSHAIWVMNVDGLKEPKTEEKLQNALRRLYPWSLSISLVISKAEPIITEQQRSAGEMQLLESFRVTATNGTEKKQDNSLVQTIHPTDVLPPSERFVKTSAELSSLPPVNSFTKDDFHSKVQAQFASPKGDQ
jgi:hypothetical protein